MAEIDRHAARTGRQGPHRIVIVGGGVGGLGLATRLGETLGKAGDVQVVLVDRSPTHFWKPLLHEAASGQSDPATHQLQYAVQAQRSGFEFEQGELAGIDRAQQLAMIGATHDADGREILPTRQLAFDTLVLALGSVTNFFGVRGAAEHALPLESVVHAEAFRRKLLDACIRANHARRTNAADAAEGFLRMQFQMTFRKALLQRGAQLLRLDQCLTVANGIVRIALERDIGEVLPHPSIEHIVQKEIT